MGAPVSITMPRIVTPGEMIDISIALTAPETPGTYRGNWSFEDHTGQRFGLGNNGTGEIWVQVEVVSAPTSTATLTAAPTQTSTATPQPPFINTDETLVYDLIADACSAIWTVNGAVQPCPGSAEALQASITVPILEDGSEPGYRAIRINPGAANDVVIATYPEYLVEPGDQFRALASCGENALTCSALFRLNAQDDTGAVTDLWAVGEFQDGSYTEISVDLGGLTGKRVRFTLSVTMLNGDPDNAAFWVAPAIYRIPVPTATPTLTATTTVTVTPSVTPTPALPTPTPTPTTPQTPPTIWEAMQQFFDDLFERLFGG
jgi:hypothetical protein